MIFLFVRILLLSSVTRTSLQSWGLFYKPPGIVKRKILKNIVLRRKNFVLGERFGEKTVFGFRVVDVE